MHLVDTPGFDDTLRSDADVLKEIAYWLSNAYVSNVRLSGIIYIHPIASDRMPRSALKTLRVMREAWGASVLPSVALVTTMWDIVEPALGASRELELVSKFWMPLIDRGSFAPRYANSRDSALKIIDFFMTREKITLDIQHEMVDKNMNLKDTAAGHQLQEELDTVFGEEYLSGKETYLDTFRVRDRMHRIVNLERPATDEAKHIAEVKAALDIRAAQLAASKDQEFREELAKVQRQQELAQARYRGQNESLYNLIGSNSNLQQALGVGAAVTTPVAASCTVM